MKCIKTSGFHPITKQIAPLSLNLSPNLTLSLHYNQRKRISLCEQFIESIIQIQSRSKAEYINHVISSQPGRAHPLRAILLVHLLPVANSVDAHPTAATSTQLLRNA
jgi:hypothetical protein